MTTRVWTIAGCVLGVAATIMLTVLITLAYGVGVPAGPRFTAAAVVTGLLGLGSINGSPPHARGGLRELREETTLVRIPPACAGRTLPPVRGDRWQRITPACAGRTPWCGTDPGDQTDHPRMRGEDRTMRALSSPTRGSPPHARGGLSRSEIRRQIARITPACAGRTTAPRKPTG